MNTHTPGKWVICNKTETQIFIASVKSGARSEQGKGSYICQIKQEREHYGINKQDEANAHLIAAAPTMLEALEEALDQLESWNQESEPTFTMRRVKEAINAAKGETEQ